MNPTYSVLDLFFGPSAKRFEGTDLPKRPVTEFVGAVTVEDDETNQSVRVRVGVGADVTNDADDHVAIRSLVGNATTTNATPLEVVLDTMSANGAWALDVFVTCRDSLDRNGTEVAPKRTFVHPAILQEAEEILGTRDASDFEDALFDSIMRVNDWAPVSPQTTHPTFDANQVARALGREQSERYFAAMKRLSREGTSGRREAPEISDYLGPLYSENIPPLYRMRMFDFLCGYMAHLTLVVSLDKARPLAPYIRDGLVRALEKAADASEYIDRYRATK